MGNCWAGLIHRKKLRRHIVLILIGLDNAGKTKTVNNLVGEKDDYVLPTVGFKAVNLIHKDVPVTIYDLGGSPQFRSIWPQYYSEVHGVIFVIDSSDYSRLDECRTVLDELLSHDRISGKPILILANKQDKKGALDDIDVVEKLNIEPLVNKYRCPTLVESYSASISTNKSKKPKIDPGLKKGYTWLLNYIVKRYGDLNLRVQTDIHTDLERRKRLMTKASNRASQTFTAVSDDIATQTGFDNPNYDSLKRQSTDKVIDEDGLGQGVIVVKPIINHHPNSLDTTVTIESADSSGKPKLSPLFGRASDGSEVIDNHIELEARREFRKLSPLKGRALAFEELPQSSPSMNRDKTTSIQDEDFRSSSIADNTVDSSAGSERRRVVLDARDLINDVTGSHRDATRGLVQSSVNVQTCRSLPGAGRAAAARPVSASQLLRRQLEATTQHKRRLSLRYIQRNKTSPERLGIFHYEPTKAAQLDMDKGDFDTSHYLTPAPRDVTL